MLCLSKGSHTMIVIAIYDTQYSLSTSSVIDHDDMTLVVKHTGDVLIYWQEVNVFTCVLDVQDFPYDTQTCQQFYVPWTSQSTGVRLIAGNGSNADYYRTNMGKVYV